MLPKGGGNDGKSALMIRNGQGCLSAGIGCIAGLKLGEETSSFKPGRWEETVGRVREIAQVVNYPCLFPLLFLKANIFE